MHVRSLVSWSQLALLAALPGCALPPEGLATTRDGEGPMVVFDFDRRPLPEIPFPNDIATRPDSTSPTGLRINASLIAATDLEATARKRLDELTGWGVYQPISVRFDQPLDLRAIYERHRDYRWGSEDYDFANDAVYLVDVTPTSPTYLEPVALDFGEGNFPVLLRTPHQYWEHDPKTISKALTFETHDEDVDGDGEMDPGEDLDLDGVLDRANVHPLEDGDPDLDPVDDLMSFYERETNTLVFKPIIPLREKTTYAVVLTTRLVGEDGDPIRSPFPYVNHTSQTDELEPALEALAEYGLDAEDIAFAWTYTTQDASSDLVDLRNGLYGEGPLSWIAEDFPAELVSMYPMLEQGHSFLDTFGVDDTNAYLLPSELVQLIIGPLATSAFGIGDIEKLKSNHRFIEYHVSGTFRSPRLLDLDDEGNLDARAWPADLHDPALRDRIAYHDVQFWCAVPRREYVDAWAQAHGKAPGTPSPVVLYAHGYTSNKIEPLGLALHAKFGITSCGMDAVLHGIQVPADSAEDLRNVLKNAGIGPAYDTLTATRAVDVDADGVVDVGAEFFSGYLFRTRDNLRQTLLDWLTLVRLLRTFGDGTMADLNGDGVPELKGDFDGDGLVDFGGRDNDYFASGTSLGGLVSSMLAAIEPSVIAAAPISGGAGLVDLGIRSEQGGVVEAMTLRLLGPLLMGEPSAAGDGTMRIYQLVVNGNQVERRDLAFLAGMQPGDTVMVTNLDSEGEPESRCARIMPMAPPAGYEGFVGWGGGANCSANDIGGCRACEPGSEGTYACDLAGTFRLGIPATKGDRLRLDVFAGNDAVEVTGDERDCAPKAEAELRASLSTLELPSSYRGVDYYVGDPLVALEDGYGFQRATPTLRRFSSIAQMVVEKADPAVYAVHYSRDPLTFIEGEEPFQKRPTNVLNVTTIGDRNVPVNTGVAIAKVAGFIELRRPDIRWGKTVNRLIIDEGVQQGIPWLESTPGWGPVLVDIDNLSNSANMNPMDPTGAIDGLVSPRVEPPLRNVVPTFGSEDGGLSGIVFPLLHDYEGRHGFPPPGIEVTPGGWDGGQFMEHMLGLYFASGGRDVRFDACLAVLDPPLDPTAQQPCPYIPAVPEDE